MRKDYRQLLIVFSHANIQICNTITTIRYRKLLKAAYLSHFLNLVYQVFFLDTYMLLNSMRIVYIQSKIPTCATTQAALKMEHAP